MQKAICSWDMTFKNTDGSDYVVGQIWGCDQADRYLLAQVRARLDFTETVPAVKALLDWGSERWRIGIVVIEDAANGPAVISTLKRKISGVVPSSPRAARRRALTRSRPKSSPATSYLPAGPSPRPPATKTPPARSSSRNARPSPTGPTTIRLMR